MRETRAHGEPGAREISCDVLRPADTAGQSAALAQLTVRVCPRSIPFGCCGDDDAPRLLRVRAYGSDGGARWPRVSEWAMKTCHGPGPGGAPHPGAAPLPESPPEGHEVVFAPHSPVHIHPRERETPCDGFCQ